MSPVGFVKISKKERNEKNMGTIDLKNLGGGALQEQFEAAFAKVMENLSDPNTSHKETRKITINLKFTQNESRDDVACDILVTTKLAPRVPARTAFAIEREGRNGAVCVEEYGRNQMSIGDLGVDHETGEVTS